MPELLELAQLVEQHRVPEVQLGGSGIEAGLDSERLSRLEPRAEIIGHEALASPVAYHDTIGGACSVESNALRYGHHTKSQHACVENFLEANSAHGRNKRDMVSNINWFMNVPVEADGALGIVDVISAPGLFVDLRAEMDLTIVVSNCPQINNPCNGFNPTPVRMIIAEP